MELAPSTAAAAASTANSDFISSGLSELPDPDEFLGVILTNLEAAIGARDLEQTDIALGQFIIRSYWDQAQFQQICIAMLQLATKVQFVDGVVAIINKFTKSNTTEELLPLRTAVFLWHIDDIEVYKLIKAAFPLDKFFIHMTRLIDYQDSDAMLSACEILDKVYGEQSYAVYFGLQSYAYERHATYIGDWLGVKVSQVNNEADKPEWVRDFGLTDIPPVKPLDYALPSPDAAATMLLEYAAQYKISTSNYEATHAALAAKYAASTKDVQKKMLADVYKYHYMNALTENETYFRLLGPVHAMTGFNSADIDHPCVKYGGCRAFTCNHMVTEDDDDSMYHLDFFTGICAWEKCRKRIISRVHVFRQPMRGGGWGPIFCSKEHTVNFMTEIAGDAAPVKYEFDIVDQIEKDLLRIGIQDRPETGPILPWPTEDYSYLRPANTVPITQILGIRSDVVVDEKSVLPLAVVTDASGMCFDDSVCPRK